MRQLPDDLIPLIQDRAVFDSALLVLSMATDGGRARWATDEMLVFVDWCNQAGVRRADFNHVPPVPADAVLTKTPGDDAMNYWPVIRHHQWHWWALRGLLPPAWTDADTERAEEKAARLRAKELEGREAALREREQYLERMRAEGVRVRTRSRRFNNAAARRRAIEAGGWACPNMTQKQPGKRATPCNYVNDGRATSCDVCSASRPPMKRSK